MIKIDLNGKWNGYGRSIDGEEMNFTGTVPGCVHTDLLNEGKIEDPFWRDNADKCQWIEKWAWKYERDFQVNEGCATENSYIEFKGLDVYCDVYLNEVLIGSASNMHLCHKFPTKGLLHEGNNHIAVHFTPPTAPTFGKQPRCAVFTWERMYTRRIQCTYSWDWVHRFLTCGICNDVTLCYPSLCELENVHIQTKAVDSFGAQVKLEYNFNVNTSGAYVETEITDPQGNVAYSQKQLIVEKLLVKCIDFPNPQLWWPNGYGKPNLYTISIKITKDGEVLSSHQEKFGIRTLRILQQQDLPGSKYYDMCLALKKESQVSGEFARMDRNEEFSGFILLVNETPIMCKGGNWVPCSPFVSDETDEKMSSILELSVEGHLNMIRIWGGGVFEKDHFYEECDRLGILVTQDFLMACGFYPEEEDWFLEELRKEAKEIALRLRNRPCLAWWTGDNENACDYDDNVQDFPGRRSAQLAIGPVLNELDPDRAFLGSSPYGGTPYASPTVGTTHYTYLSDEMFTFIRETDMKGFNDRFNSFLGRFSAESPTLGAPSVSSLKKFMTEDDIFGADEHMWRYHTKNNPCPEFEINQLHDHSRLAGGKMYGEITNGADRVAKMQYFQYDWIRHSMELYRRKKWFSSGQIYWMLNDCWPASGWSIIDFYSMPKAGFFGFKKASKPVIASMEKHIGLERAADTYDLYVCSDILQETKGKVWLFVLDLAANEATKTWSKEFTLAPNSSECILSISATELELFYNKNCIPVWEMESDNGYDRGFLCQPRPQDIALPDTEVCVVSQGNDFIEVTADKFVMAVVLDGECIFEDNYFSLLPGEKRKINFRPLVKGNEVGKISVSRVGGMS